MKVDEIWLGHNLCICKGKACRQDCIKMISPNHQPSAAARTAGQTHTLASWWHQLRWQKGLWAFSNRSGSSWPARWDRGCQGTANGGSSKATLRGLWTSVAMHRCLRSCSRAPQSLLSSPLAVLSQIGDKTFFLAAIMVCCAKGIHLSFESVAVLRLSPSLLKPPFPTDLPPSCLHRQCATLDSLCF